MSIIRSPRPKGHFTIISNETLRDSRLSYRSRGLLCAILSRPDDWRTSADSLAREGKEGRDAILKALKELEDFGYMERVKSRDPKTGRISQHSIVYDHPNTRNEKSDPGEPASGCPTSVSSTALEELSTKKLDKTATAQKSRSDEKAVQVAKQWWDSQNPKPAGNKAWFALLNACRAVSERGWTNDQILTALNRIKAVPSVAQLDRELRTPRPETFTERKAREEREERERIEARRQREIEESAERRRKWDEEAANAVPPPPEFREAVRKLKQRSA